MVLQLPPTYGKNFRRVVVLVVELVPGVSVRFTRLPFTRLPGFPATSGQSAIEINKPGAHSGSPVPDE